MLSFANVGRRINNREFVALVAGSWVGTSIEQSGILAPLIRQVLATGKTVTLAIKHMVADRRALPEVEPNNDEEAEIPRANWMRPPSEIQVGLQRASLQRFLWSVADQISPSCGRTLGWMYRSRQRRSARGCRTAGRRARSPLTEKRKRQPNLKPASHCAIFNKPVARTTPRRAAAAAPIGDCNFPG